MTTAYPLPQALANQETGPLSVKAVTDEQLDEIKQALSPHVELFLRGDPGFQVHSRLFNGSIQSPSALLVRVVIAKDVSEVIKFATRHDFSISVKAGGYGTAGYAIQGDIIVDLCAMDELSIEAPIPNPDASSAGHIPYTSLRDIPEKGTKGKEKIIGFKRRPTPPLPPPLPGSIPISAPEGDLSSESAEPQPKVVRRRLDGFEDSRAPREDSVSWSADSGMSTSTSTPGTSVHANSKSPSPPTNVLPSLARSSISSATTIGGGTGDPFAYLDSPEPVNYGLPSSQQQRLRPSSSTAVSGTTRVTSNSSSSISISNMITFTYGPSLFSPSQYLLGFSTELKPVHTHAYVTISTGARQKAIDHFTDANPLSAVGPDGQMSGCIPYHVPLSAHPNGSSALLLGGFGLLSRLHGLSSDSVVEIEMVLADGSIVYVSERENPDLWWAIRGAAPAFGVVTRIKAKAYPVPLVFAGTLIYTFRSSTAGSFIKHIRDCVKYAPRELYINIIMTAGPTGSLPIIAVQLCYNGPKEKGQEFVDAIKAWDGETCVLNDVSVRSFLIQQESVEKMLKGIWGRKWFMRSDLIASLTDEIIASTVIKFANTPLGCTWIFELAGGAVADFEDSCFPKKAREATWTVAAFHQWDIWNDEPRCVAAAEEWIAQDMKLQSTGGPLPSFLARFDTPERTRGTFGGNWKRLVELKRKYDPHMLFKHNFWLCSGDEKVGEVPKPEASLATRSTERVLLEPLN